MGLEYQLYSHVIAVSLCEPHSIVKCILRGELKNLVHQERKEIADG